MPARARLSVLRTRLLGIARRTSGSGGAPAWTVAVPVIALVAGLMFAVSSRTANGSDLRSASAEIKQVIHERALENQQLEQQRGVLAAQVKTLSDNLAEHDASTDALAQQTAQAETAAGLTEVHGPAVRVTLTDAPLGPDGELPAGARPDDVVIHQSDVQGVVNAMWAAGAEAVMIQDKRLIMTSAVRCVGNTLLLGGRVYSPPFVIVGLGDQDAIEQALKKAPGVQLFLDAVQAFGLGYDVKRLDDVTFPAYRGGLGVSHAKATG